MPARKGKATKGPVRKTSGKKPAHRSASASSRVSVRSATSLNSNRSVRSAVLVPRRPVADAKTTRALLLSQKDYWQAEIARNLVDPMHEFPLPGIHISGTSSQPLFIPSAAWSGGRETSGLSATGVVAGSGPGGMGMYVLNNVGTPVHLRMLEMDSELLSNYNVFPGTVVSNITLPVADGATYNVWVGFNPYSSTAPIIYSFWKDDGSAAPLDNFQTVGWLGDPYVMPTYWVGADGASQWPLDQSVGGTPVSAASSQSSQRPAPHVTRAERAGWDVVSESGRTSRAPPFYYDGINYYFAGGSELELAVGNVNAFSAVSMRSRSDATVCKRFFTSIDTLSPSDPDSQYGDTEPYLAANYGYSAHTGSLWTNALREDDLSHEYLQDRMRFIIASGLPFIQAKFSASASSGIQPLFSLRAATWLGVAPTTLRFAMVCPMQTVACEYPAWARAARLRGYVAETPALARTIAGGNALRTAARQVGDGSVMHTAISSSPEKTESALRNSRSAFPEVLKTLAMAALPIVGSMIPGGGMASKIASTVLRSVPKVVNSVPRNIIGLKPHVPL